MRITGVRTVVVWGPRRLAYGAVSRTALGPAAVSEHAIFTLCEAAGMPCMIGSVPECGIGTAAQIHLGVAMTNLGPDTLRRGLPRPARAFP